MSTLEGSITLQAFGACFFSIFTDVFKEIWEKLAKKYINPFMPNKFNHFSVKVFKSIFDVNMPDFSPLCDAFLHLAIEQHLLDVVKKFV